MKFYTIKICIGLRKRSFDIHLKEHKTNFKNCGITDFVVVNYCESNNYNFNLPEEPIIQIFSFILDIDFCAWKSFDSLLNKCPIRSFFLKSDTNSLIHSLPFPSFESFLTVLPKKLIASHWSPCVNRTH